MDVVSIVLVVLALCLFEIVNSIDNAVVDADILRTVKHSSRKIFMFWDIFFSVLIVRGVFPLLIVFAMAPSVGLVGALTASSSSDPTVTMAMSQAVPYVLIAAGIFFVLLFLDWIFRKPKNFAHLHERLLHGKEGFFDILALVLISVVVFASLALNPYFVLPVFIGSTVFFILHGLKNQFHVHRTSLAKNENASVSDFNKLVYLELIDSVFSIDSVLGAFAFTFSVPLIMLGAGLGAIVVRVIALNNADTIKRYAYLRNGAMYSIFFLGLAMLLEAFGAELPFWLSPLVTMCIIGYFVHRSHAEARILKQILQSTH